MIERLIQTKQNYFGTQQEPMYFLAKAGHLHKFSCFARMRSYFETEHITKNVKLKCNVFNADSRETTLFVISY